MEGSRTWVPNLARELVGKILVLDRDLGTEMEGANLSNAPESDPTLFKVPVLHLEPETEDGGVELDQLSGQLPAPALWIIFYHIRTLNLNQIKVFYFSKNEKIYLLHQEVSASEANETHGRNESRCA